MSARRRSRLLTAAPALVALVLLGLYVRRDGGSTGSDLARSGDRSD